MDGAFHGWPMVEHFADLLRQEGELAADLRETTTRALLDRLPQLATAEQRSVATLLDHIRAAKGEEPIALGELRTVVALADHFLTGAGRVA